MVSTPNAADLVKRIQEWYLARCNGDWEHSYGVKIDTLDNPGWIVTIDLAETEWCRLEIARTVVEMSESDWVQWEVTNAQFVGCGGPLNLPDLLETFLSVVGRSQ